MTRKPYLAAVAACALLAGCNKAEAPASPAAAAITEAEAGQIADATVSAWGSMDAAKVKALYAPDVVAFDFAVPGLSADRADFDKRQDAFVALKMDKYVQKERKIQIFDADTFILSGTWDGSSTAVPANDGPVRCTDVFRRQADGKWLIVNEHCSAVPKAS